MEKDKYGDGTSFLIVPIWGFFAILKIAFSIRLI